MGRDIPQDHENKVSRTSEIFMINRKKYKYKNHYVLWLQKSTVCQEN